MRMLLAVLAMTAAACSSTAAPEAPEAPDQCRASDYQWLIGRKKSEIPAQPPGATWRIACTTCPVTMDYSPRRMNIFFDERTQVIQQVKCG